MLVQNWCSLPVDGRHSLAGGTLWNSGEIAPWLSCNARWPLESPAGRSNSLQAQSGRVHRLGKQPQAFADILFALPRHHLRPPAWLGFAVSLLQRPCQTCSLPCLGDQKNTWRLEPHSPTPTLQTQTTDRAIQLYQSVAANR